MTPRLRHALTALACVAALVPQLALSLPKEVDAVASVILVALAAYGITPAPREDDRV